MLNLYFNCKFAHKIAITPWRIMPFQQKRIANHNPPILFYNETKNKCPIMIGRKRIQDVLIKSETSKKTFSAY